jgi:RNA polymerase sigma factor (TIGR02999 family)
MESRQCLDDQWRRASPKDEVSRQSRTLSGFPTVRPVHAGAIRRHPDEESNRPFSVGAIYQPAQFSGGRIYSPVNLSKVSDVTRMLESIQAGDPKTGNELLPLVYEELRRLAAARMAREGQEYTLQATALVHEAWLALIGDENVKWEGRAHFFGAAAEAMRRILINNARKRRATRHGGGQQRLDINDLEIPGAKKDEEMLAVDEALEKFAAHDPVKAQLVKLKYFAGMNNEEAAALLGISEPTAKRHWAYAKAWLLTSIESSR